MHQEVQAVSLRFHCCQVGKCKGHLDRDFHSSVNLHFAFSTPKPGPAQAFGGWMAETCRCLFLQLSVLQEWDAESTAPAVSSFLGCQRQLHPWVHSSPQGWTTVSGALSPSPPAPCPQPLGRLQMQPRLLAMEFAPVALLPSQPVIPQPLRNQ